jgi:hypothetical protein
MIGWLVKPIFYYDVHVRLETHSSLVTTNAQDGSTSGDVSITAASPFPDDIVELLQIYRALSVNIQVRNMATQSFPTSPFQLLELDLEEDQQEDEGGEQRWYQQQYTSTTITPNGLVGCVGDSSLSPTSPCECECYSRYRYRYRYRYRCRCR